VRATAVHENICIHIGKFLFLLYAVDLLLRHIQTLFIISGLVLTLLLSSMLIVHMKDILFGEIVVMHHLHGMISDPSL
jgi:hypothetical protein